MAADFRFSTSSFSPQNFKPHGTVDSKVVGNLFIQEATGPFNKEIVLAMDVVHAEARGLLLSGGAWGALFVFKNSALASPEMLDRLQKYLSMQVTRKNASVATGLVLPHSVEGAAFMAPLYVRAWRNAGICCEAFVDYLEAHSWVSKQLEGKTDLPSQLALTSTAPLL
jgi:hypothetical protein